MRVRCARSAGGLALLTLAAAGCGTASGGGGAFHPNGGAGSTLPSAGASASAGSATTATTAAAAPTAMTTPEFTKAVLDAYLAYQKAYKTAYAAGSPTGLRAVAMDPALSVVTKDVEQVVAKHLVYRFTLQLNPKVQSWRLDRSTAVVADCIRTLDWYSFSTVTGKRVRSGGVSGTTLSRFGLRYDPAGGTWKVYAIEGQSKC
jgi:hypothetical protein